MPIKTVFQTVFFDAFVHGHVKHRISSTHVLALCGNRQCLADPDTASQSPSQPLPRLGSRVRIPSPAPKFLKEISDIVRSFGAFFCFPALACRAGEAWGKLREAGCRGRTAAFGLGNCSSKHASLLSHSTDFSMKPSV